MIKKRGRMLTLLFSMFPGAGHMWNGFMKRGLSLTVLFAAAWTLAYILNIGVFGMLVAVIWFYAFFDCINLRFQDDQDFYAQRDEYLFTVDDVMQFSFASQRMKLIAGVGLIFTGISILWESVILAFLRYLDLPDYMWEFIYGVGRIAPRIIVAVVIIWIGLRLIVGERRKNKAVFDEAVREKAQDVVCDSVYEVEDGPEV